MVGDAEVAEFEGEAHEMGYKVRGVNTAIYKYCAVNVGVVCGGVNGRLACQMSYDLEKGIKG